MAITTKKVDQLSNLGTLQAGDVVVGERTSGTTGLLTVGSSSLVSDGDKGDITVSASGAAWTIDNDAVTYAKIQNVSTTDVILGRSSVGAGNIEEISCTAAGRALLDDVDASAQRTTLGLGTLATQNGTFSGTSSGTNTGDQTSIVGITGTKAEFDTAVTDGNFLYVGDVTQYTDEMAQDAIGSMIDTTLNYVDGTPLLQRAALTGDVTASAGSNATTIATPASATVATDDKVLIKDTDAADVMKYVTAQSIRDLVPGSNTITSTQLATALTDETGSGSAVFATSPTLVTPNIGVATSTQLDVDNLRLDGNTLSITSTNGSLILAANGTGTYQFSGSSSQSAFLRIFEDTDNGSNFVQITVPSSVTANRTVTIPDADGTVTLLGNTSTGSGNVVLATSPTLVTPVLGVASATSISFGDEALSSYDEGSWTPVPFGSTTAGSPTGTFDGRYVKIGKLVNVTMRLVFTSLDTMAGSFRISGLPFTVVNSVSARSGWSTGFRNSWTNDFPIEGYSNSNTTEIRFYDGSVDNTPVNITDLSATTQLYGSITYEVA